VIEGEYVLAALGAAVGEGGQGKERDDGCTAKLPVALTVISKLYFEQMSTATNI
jgi:hypothetical protein